MNLKKAKIIFFDFYYSVLKPVIKFFFALLIKIYLHNFYYSVLKPVIKFFFALLIKIYLHNLPRKTLEPQKIKNVLILISPQNGLGDNIMFSYYIEDLINTYDLNICITTSHPQFWSLLEYRNLYIITCKNTKTLFKEIINSKQKFDLAIILSPYVQHLLTLPFINAPYKIGYDPIHLIKRRKKIGLINNFKINSEKKIEFDGTDDFYGYMLKLALEYCGFSVKEKIPKIKKYIHHQNEDLSSGFILVYPYAKDSLRALPTFFWVKVCERLCEEGFEVVLLSTNEALDLTNEILSQVKCSVKSIFTDSIEKTIFILNKAYCCICTDGGFMHIALLSDIPNIIAFFNLVKKEHRIPSTILSKKIKTFQIENDKIRNYLDLFSSTKYKSFFEYKPKIVKEVLKEYENEVENLFKTEYKNFLDEIIEFLKAR